MFGTFVNTLAIAAGSLVGLAFRGGIPLHYQQTVIQAIGLAVVLIGMTSALKTPDILVVIFSLALGSIVGEWLRIEARLNHLGRWLENKCAQSAEGGIAKGFVTASLIYCVGSMAIVGSMESGLTGNHQTLYAKSVLDGISAIIFASSLGAGVLFSAMSVGVYQGILTLSAVLMKPYLIPMVVDQMSSVGGILIMAIGFNLLEIKKMNVGNMLPAIFMPLAYYMIQQMIR
ncbi:MAG: DUF554 domain-containing protein [Deltaproteobacteria bacterium]|nr:DUF554 domain-containing protein [Deltaproteobacteria bacterium]